MVSLRSFDMALGSSRENQVDPLFAFAFLQSFVEILREYFGAVSAATMKDNFDVVYQVRQAYFYSRFVCEFIYSFLKKHLTPGVTHSLPQQTPSVTSSSLLHSFRSYLPICLPLVSLCHIITRENPPNL